MGAVPDTMFSGNLKTPWHGLGTVVAGLLTAEEALVASGLTWNVNLQPIYNGDMNPIEGFFASTRDDNGKALGVVGSRYHVIQNVDGFDFIDSLLGDGSAKFETAGSLYGGKTVWMLAKLDQDVFVAGDKIEPYFLLKNTHDGSGALKVLTTPVRVVCQNTLNAAVDEGKRSFSIRHTRNYEDKIKTASQTLGLTRKYYESFVDFATNLVNQKFSKSEFEKLLDTLIVKPVDEGRGRTKAIAEQSKLMMAYNADDIDNVRFTKWGAYNAVADYSDHMRQLRGTTDVRLDNAYARTFEGTDLKDLALAILTA